MEFLTQHEVLAHFLVNYGGFALFGLLALGIIALPVPDESLMVLAGVLMFNDTLNVHSTIFAAYAGSITGISISYVLGRTFGKYMIRRFGSWIGLTSEKIHQVHDWFRHLGKWALFFGYFIPGVRHLTGVVAGSIGLPYNYFALFSYSGAVVWASTFISLGYFFGNYWILVLEWVEIYIDEIVIAGIVGFIIYLIFLSARRK